MDFIQGEKFIREIFLPMWGHFSSIGLDSKFDSTQNINYFF